MNSQIVPSKLMSKKPTIKTSANDRLGYYALLGVHPGASAAELKKAYHELAMKWHPDRNPGGNAEFIQKIMEAYSVLQDPERRKQYDAGQNVDVRSDMNSVRVVLKDFYEMSTISARMNADPELAGIFSDLLNAVDEARVNGTWEVPEELVYPIVQNGAGYIVRAIRKALDQKFVCAECNDAIGGLDALCWCEQTDTGGAHCLNKCCVQRRKQHQQLMRDLARSSSDSEPNLLARVANGLFSFANRIRSHRGGTHRMEEEPLD